MFTKQLCRDAKFLSISGKTFFVFSILLVTGLISPLSWAGVVHLNSDYADSTSENSHIEFTANVPSDTTFVIGIAHSSRSQSPSAMSLGGDLMTRVDDLCYFDGGRQIGFFILHNPNTGSQSAYVHYDGSKKRGKIASVHYYKGVDPSNPLGKKIRESSSDPFKEPGNFIEATDLPPGSEVITAYTGGVISSLTGKHFGDATLGSFLAGGGTVSKIFDRRPRQSTSTDYVCTGAVYRVYGTFNSTVKPNLDNYTGDGTAVAGVINPAPMNVTYVCNPPQAATITGPSKIAEVIGSVNFTVQPNPGYEFNGIPTASNGTVTGSGTSYMLSNVTTDTTVTANFNAVFGDLTVNITGPTSARWSIDGGTIWNKSGDTLNVPVGNKTVTFNELPGVIKPADQSAAVTLNGSTVVTSTYQAKATYLAESGGSISGTAVQTVNYGAATSAVTAIPSTGYSFDRWNDGKTTATRTDNPTTESTFTALFKNNKPVISVNPISITVQCPEAYTEAQAREGVTVFDAEETLDPANIVISDVSFPLTAVGIHTIRYNISDTPGLAAEEKTRTVNVQDTVAPVIVISGANPLELACGDTFTVPDATVIDSCADDRSASIYSNNVNPAKAGSYSVVYRGNDGNGNWADPVTLTVNVVDAVKPVITLLGADPMTMQCGESFVDPGAMAQDDCEGNITARVVVNTSQLKTKVPGSYTVSYTVSDISGNAADPVTRTVIVEDTTAPVVVPLGNAAVTVECGGSYQEFGATAVDACAGTLPASAISWDSPVDTSVPGVYTVTYTAVDAAGNTGTATRTVTVEDTTPPEFITSGIENTVTVAQGNTYTYPTLEAWDACDGPVSVIRSGETVNTDVIKNYIVTFTATDSKGLSVSRNITVQVVNPAAPSIVKVEVEGPFSVLVTWNREVAGINAALDPANYTVVGSGAGTLSIHPLSVSLQSDAVVRLLWADNAGEMLNGGDIIIVVPADFEDNFGNPVGARMGEDSDGAIGLAPVITLTGGDMQLECNIDVYNEPGATVVDNIDGSMTPHIAGYVNTSLPGEYVIAYSAQDTAGNKALELRRIMVEDATPPLLELLGNAAMEVECGDVFIDPFVTAYDQCDGDLSEAVVIGGDEVNTSLVGTSFTITYGLSDSTGNVATSISRTVTIVDTTGPAIVLPGDNPLVLDGVLTFNDPGATAIDACGNVDYSGDIQSSNNVNPMVEGNYEIVYTVSDMRGNETTAVRGVVVRRQNCDLLYDLEVDPNPAFPGETVTMMAVELPGSCTIGTVHYQWEKRTANKAGDFLPIPNADNLSQFVLYDVEVQDSGEYRCTVTDNMISRHTPVVTLTVGTGIPVAGGLGLALTAVVTLMAGAAALRKKRD